MKKLLLLLSVATALSAAAIEPPKQIITSYPRMIPDFFTAEGNCVMATESDNIITAYNSNLDVLATITLPKPEDIEYTYWRQERKYAYKTITLKETVFDGNYLYADYYDEYGNHIELKFEEIDSALEYLRNHGHNPVVGELDGKTIIITSYVYDSSYDQKFIEYYYIFEDGLWRRYHNLYDKDDWGPYGEWDEVETITQKAWTESSSRVIPLNNGIDYDGTYITQTLFNSDKEFEYVVPKYQKFEYSYESETRREGGEKVKIAAFSVMCQNGTKLFDIDVPAEYNNTSCSPYYNLYSCVMDEKRYIAVDMEGRDEEFFLFYELEGKSGVKAPKIVKSSMRVEPRMPRHGETVKVDLGEEAAAATKISVVSANGSTVRILPISAGQRSVELQTSGLASGMYVVTANGREAAKIIIR